MSDRHDSQLPADLSEIAERLHLSVRTVETHRAHIQQKLRLSTRAELVHYALERGLLDLANGAGR